MSHILLIDDDGDMSTLVARWLTRVGYEVSKALSGAEALALLEGVKPDLILPDYAMPQMDGPATFREICKNESTEDIPILFRAGKEDGSTADIIKELHPDGVVSRAEGKASLLKAIAATLQAA